MGRRAETGRAVWCRHPPAGPREPKKTPKWCWKRTRKKEKKKNNKKKRSLISNELFYFTTVGARWLAEYNTFPLALDSRVRRVHVIVSLWFWDVYNFPYRRLLLYLMAITCFDFASFLYRISPIFFISVFQQQRAPMPLPNSFRVIGRRPEFKPSSGSPTTSGPVLEAFSPPKNHCHQLALPIGKTKKSYNKTLFLKRERPSIGENIQPEPVIITSRPTRFRGPVNLYSSPSRRACNQKGKKKKNKRGQDPKGAPFARW